MRVIPPLTGASTTITEAMLTSSTAVETPPAAYAGGTTYAIGAQVSVFTGTVADVYESLVNLNTGNPPATSPTQWKWISQTHKEWLAGTNYALGDTVIVAALHKEFASAQAGNLNHNPATDDGTWWTELGPTAPWKAFDLLRNTGCETSSPQVAVITPGERVDSIAVVGMVAGEVSVVVKRSGVTIYSRTLDLSTRSVTGWYDYFFQPFSFKEEIALFDLPPVTGAEVTVTLTRDTGNVTCGGILPGRAVYLGEIEVAPEDDALNFSTVDRDDFGNAELIPRRTIPKTAQTLWVDKSEINKIRAARDLLNAVPALWSGLDDVDDGYFAALLILGFYRRFTIGLEHKDLARITLELEEV
jgi:hypothetical protein